MEETSFRVGQCYNLHFGVMVGLISKLLNSPTQFALTRQDLANNSATTLHLY